jgi:hypothetical protein
MGESQEMKKDRGWGLTVLIPLGIVGSVLNIIIILLDILFFDGIYSEQPFQEVLFALIQLSLLTIFLIAAWRWKRWGCFGLMLTVILGAVLALMRGLEPITLVGAAIVIGILYAVYRSKKQHFA